MALIFFMKEEKYDICEFGTHLKLVHKDSYSLNMRGIYGEQVTEWTRYMQKIGEHYKDSAEVEEHGLMSVVSAKYVHYPNHKRQRMNDHLQITSKKRYKEI